MQGDMDVWRRYVWSHVHAGIAAWQANNLDSAIHPSSARTRCSPTSRRPQIRRDAVLQHRQVRFRGRLFGGPRTWRRRIPVHGGPQDALYNLGASASLGQLLEAQAPIASIWLCIQRCRDHGGVGRVYMQRPQGQRYRDSAFTIYRQIVSKGDSMGYFSSIESVPRSPERAGRP